MNDSIAFFLPARKGSERVKNKNTRPFAGHPGGITEVKISQLLQSRRISEIIFSTNDDACIEVARKFKDTRLRIVRRPDNLCLSTTNLQDLINYVPAITDAQHILWGHATTPLCGAEQYDRAIDEYLSHRNEGYDSLIGVSLLKNFLLDASARIVNNDTPLPWPRTQDLTTLYEINHTMFIASRETYINDHNRVGRKPYLYEMDKITSMDIDWEDDFVMAEIMFNHKNNQ